MLQTIETSGSLIFGIIAMITSVVALVISIKSTERDGYTVALSLLTDLTTNEVAEARDGIGTLRYGSKEGIATLNYSRIIKDYYTLEWALERTNYALRGIRMTSSSIQKSLEDVIRWHCIEILTAISIIRKADDHEFNDAESMKQLRQIAETLNKVDTLKNFDAIDILENPSPDEVKKVRGNLQRLQATPR
jgi:hypothetical protein